MQIAFVMMVAAINGLLGFGKNCCAKIAVNIEVDVCAFLSVDIYVETVKYI